MPTISDMSGKVALVTGAAAGLGQATALCLARAGADICLVDINLAGLQATAREIESLGRRALIQAADLAETSQCATLVKNAITELGRLDALCNVAAVFIPSHTTEMSDADWERTLAVNYTAPFKLIRAAIPELIRNQGAVVNVTSCAAHMGQAYLAAYSSTKAALTHLTKSLAMEYMHQPIRFNAVAPGGMMTALAAGLRNLENPDPSLLSRIAPLRGLNEIDDIAEMVAFLASDAARGYHGAVINIDNGITVG
ncbi:SDR family oxidoreductase [Halioxenophilus sp. WMMB6]|uniref:SDR family NAD(P)-dependent oxidoreductase n=1 Tax=Halioxenophilus sp. WMMB6 TaxID=3073815 RepID=UPI00295E590B|nr:SDR family oxidoreductase [Halioxenophilus sp. WMMB6]